MFLTAFGMLLKYKPWERKNGNGHGDYDKKIAGYLVEIAAHVESIGELKRDIKVLHTMLLGMDGQGGFVQELNRLRTWREEIEGEHQNIQLRISRLENRRRPEREEYK